MRSHRWRPQGLTLLLFAALGCASQAARSQQIAAEDLVASLPEAPQAAPASNAPAQGQPQPQKQTQTPAQAGQGYDLKKAEHQRIFGVVPEFNAVNDPANLPPLTPKQKFHLMWKSSTDGFVIALDAIVAGIGQAKNSNPGFGQGVQGYFKRFGSSYADTLDGNFWGNAVLTSVLHEDPRYFRKGDDYSPVHRALYSAATAVWCRRDAGGWGPNYANILGNFISGGISNLYYPAADRGFGKTLTGALTVTAEGTVGSELIEFWPDIEHRMLKHRNKKLKDLSQQP